MRKYIVILTVLLLISCSSSTVFASVAGEGTAIYKRDIAIPGCVQNFDVFGYDAGTIKKACMITGVSSKAGAGWFDLGVYDEGTKTFKKVGSTIKTIGGKTIQSHANNVEVIKYNGAYYLLFVSGTGTSSSIKCAKLSIKVDSSNNITGWGFDEANIHSVSLFPDYKGAPVTESFITSSSNYICIATAYGSSRTADTERYHIYKKSDFMKSITAGNCAQLSLNPYRSGTGMFKTGSLGLNVSKSGTVIQCIEMDEKDADTVILFGAVDDRTARMQHQINRVYLPINGSDTLTAQDLSQQHSYYSKVQSLADGSKRIDMNFDKNVLDNRFDIGVEALIK